LQGVYSVLTVDDAGRVAQRLIRPGRRSGGLWLVDDGLASGERVVVEGLQKVRPGIEVEAETVELQEDGKIAAPEQAADASAPAAPAAAAQD
jgi:membrane fusion protein (multidrug efflux system)